MRTTLNRRDFLGASAAGLGLMALAPVTGAAAAPNPTMLNRRTLIVYATRCGSTLEIARVVAEELRIRGCAVDLRPVGKVTDLAGYEVVVLGSAVRFGHWLPEAVDFVRRQQAGLGRIPTAFFTVHGLNTGPDEASRKARLAYLEPVHAVIRPSAETFFAGKMDLSRLSFGERLLCKVMSARNADMRDWSAIHTWGKSVFS
jgi:menaquinone-dependent protoporphyrinogen oxidase